MDNTITTTVLLGLRDELDKLRAMVEKLESHLSKQIASAEETDAKEPSVQSILR